jgi:hypothetical protein
MPFPTRARSVCKHVGSRILRGAAIVVIVCLAPAMILLSWCFWLVVFVFCFFAVLGSGRRSLFRYSDNGHDHT